MNTRRSLYGVKTKGGLFNIKINPADREQFKVAAELRGATMSSLIHQFIFRFIREVKMEMPEEFEARLAEVLAEKHAPAKPVPASEKLKLIANGAPVKATSTGRPSRKGGRK